MGCPFEQTGVVGEEVLTPTEALVLELVLDGLSNQEIADHRVVGIKTIETHVSKLLQKLGYRDRAQLIANVMASRLREAIPDESEDLLDPPVSGDSHVLPMDRGPVGSEADDDDGFLEAFASALRSYCDDVPSWFPDRLTFAAMRQQVSVTPPRERAAHQPGEALGSDEAPIDAEPDSRSRPSVRRLSLDAALRQFQRLVVVGDPGTGKSWATRSIALSLLPPIEAQGSTQSLPIVVLAPRLDQALQGQDPGDLDAAQIAALLVKAMPVAVVSRLTQMQRSRLADRLASGGPVAVLVDGFDEVRSATPVLGHALPALEAFCVATGSLFVLTTRPSTVPPRSTTAFGWCTLEPFGSREQWLFLERWFADDRPLARRLSSWVREHSREVMRNPLMLSLFCSVVEQGGQPPASEHELWERALLRLATEEERFGEIELNAERTRLRLVAVQAIAELFVADSLRETIMVDEVEAQLKSSKDWKALGRLAKPKSVVEDLISTGIVTRSTNGLDAELGFLHSAMRDYLIARSLSRSDSWHARIQLVWGHPEWEPVFGYLGALVKEPSELLLQLVARFASDPLNIARLVAGRALSAAPSKSVPADLARRVRDELLVMLASDDIWDGLRAARLLAILGVDGTTELLQAFLNPSAPSGVIASAIAALAGNLSPAVQGTLASVVTADHFTGSEREAAVDAIADAGTDDALDLLEEFADDALLPSRVRVAAALAAWKSFEDDKAVVRILVNDDDASVQRVLSERVVVDTDRASALAQRIRDGSLAIEDVYSRAVLLVGSSLAKADEVDGAIIDSLPSNPALDLLFEATDVATARLAADPLFATLLRFLRSSAPSRVRWLAARRVARAGKDESAMALWTNLVDDADPGDAGIMAEFIALEAETAPGLIRDLVQVSLASPDTPPIITHAVKRRLQAQADRVEAVSNQEEASSASAPGSAGAATDMDDGLPTTIEDALRSNLPALLRYGLVRVMRSQIPATGAVREAASTLTHQVSTESACAWIDAVPMVAPVVEARLLAAGEAGSAPVELARLRARWPGRSGEVGHSSSAIDAGMLDAGAEAAVADGDLTSASMLALASLGASSIDDHRPSRTAIGVLFASGHATGRANSTWQKIRSFLDTLPTASLEWTLIASWLQAGYDLTAVGQRLSTLPGYIRAGNPEVAALLLAANVTDESALDLVVSWSDCRRAQALLLASRGYASSDGVRESLEAASLALETRANVLLTAWPQATLDSPSQRGKPKAHWNLVTIGSALLMEGNPTAAVAVFETAVQQDPSDPELRNNLGFCRMPIDTSGALDDLGQASRLFGQPFNVNTANRMLAHFRLGDYERVVDLGDEIYKLGQFQGSAILWDPDDPQVLRRDVDVMLYVIDLAERASHMTGDAVNVALWGNRREAWVGPEDDLRTDEEQTNGS